MQQTIMCGKLVKIHLTNKSAYCDSVSIISKCTIITMRC